MSKASMAEKRETSAAQNAEPMSFNGGKSVEQFGNFLSQLALAIAFFVFASARTATDPFFRKNMGERYLSLPRIFLSIAGWCAVVFATPAQVKVDGSHRSPICGIIIVLAYAVFAGAQYYMTIRARQTGAYWHSKSRGESLFGSESVIRDLIVEAALATILYFASPYYAGFFVFSRVLGYVSEAMARAALYNKYLDIQDAKIEAEFMEIALRDGLEPRLTAGFSPKLPLGLKGEHQANVARVVSDGMREIKGFRAPNSMPQQAIPQAPKHDPFGEIQTAAIAGFKKLITNGVVILRSARTREVISRIAVLMFAAGILAGSFFLFRSLHNWRAHTVALKSVPANAEQQQAVSSDSPPIPTAQAPTVPKQTLESAKTAPLGEAVQPRTNDDAEAIAKVEAARIEAQKRQERESAYARMTNSLNAQSEILNQFTVYCENRFIATTNRIDALSRSRRRTEGQTYQAVFKVASFYVRKHQDYFDQTPQKLLVSFANGENPVELENTMNDGFPRMLSDRQYITNLLNALDAQLTNSRVQIPFRPTDLEFLKRQNF